MIDIFALEVEEKEKEIIEYLLKFNLFSARDEITSKILFYFITRKNLSQKAIQDLTGYSAGKISQELNNFLKLDLIKVSKNSKPWTYSMESVVIETFNRGINLLKKNVEWESKFLEIREELINNSEELEHLNGYNDIKDFVSMNLIRFSGYKEIIELWENLKNKYTATRKGKKT